MPSSVANRAATTEAKPLVGSCRAGAALAALRIEIDVCGVPRKAIAADVCAGDEPLLSKKLSGVPGRPFSLDDLDALPRAVLVKWLQRYGTVIGLKVVEMEPGEISERLLTLVDELATVAKLARIVTRPLKVKLPLDRE